MDDILEFFAQLDFSKLCSLLEYNASEPLIFSSGLFFVLFILFLMPYMGLRNSTSLRILYVCLFSLFFYYKSSGWYVLLLLLATTSDFVLAKEIAATSVKQDRKMWVTISIIINLAVLTYFKYFNMLGSLACLALSELGVILDKPSWILTEWKPWDIILPVGISFYTFQTMSYILDVYRREIKPLNRWIDYAFYVSFFPQLVAGPIVRAKDFIPQIHKRPFLSRRASAEALVLIMSGLIKKTIISDYISLNFVDRVFDAPNLYTGLENLVAVYGYALQIYCDFSGYSDMAIGIALILGFRFNINFDSPYQSASITEFWRRWHISLSSWLRDYLYIPLGGNRKGTIRTYVNLIITMLLGGLWHGASLKFVLWGGIHGLSLAAHKLWCRYFPSSASPSHQLPWWRRSLGRIITFHLVCLSWILFRADSMQVAKDILHQIGTSFHPEVIGQFVQGYRFVLLLITVGYLMHFVSQRRIKSWTILIERAPFLVKLFLFALVVFVVIQMKSSEIQPFIYFQF